MILTTELLDVHLGRAVQLVNVHGELNGPLYAFGSETLQFEANGPVFRRAEWAVFTAPLPVPVVLPTEPGTYADKNGGLWVFSAAGYLAVKVKSAAGWFSPEALEEFAPFTHLRDEAEVAAEVIAGIELEDEEWGHRNFHSALFGNARRKWGLA